MNIRSTLEPSIEVDRVQCTSTQKGFLLANQKRIERAKQGLEHNQRLVFDILPLLFHVNHPMLPGYVNQSTPCGLSNFKPGKPQLQQIKKVSKGFRYRAIDSSQDKIFSIFIMGSMGTLGQSRGSDLDIWICYDPELTLREIEHLREKCLLITRWAKQQKMELCFFPINNLTFMDGETTPLSDESSGSTQRYLLLDEFYRSALYLGGRKPLWWFVPSKYEDSYIEYCRILIEKKFVRANDVIDFGSLTDLPAQEFVTAAIWQMYKAIVSPYKSILKLVLLEVYAQQYPKPTLLAHLFKQQIELAPEDIDASDPYLLLLTTVEQYLQTQNLNKRLDTVRRCFYCKVDRSLSKLNSSTSWQTTLLRQQITRWRWGEEQLRNLDERKRWKAEQVITERQRLVSDLMNSYRVLSEFVRQQNPDDIPLHAEVTILGRKLYAAFERKAGKIEWINPDISPDISEEHLEFHPHTDEEGAAHWRLFVRREERHNRIQKAIKSNRSLAELALWSYCNRIYSTGSNAVIKSEQIEGETSLNELFFALTKWQPLPLPKANQDDYRCKPNARSLMLICNLESIREPHSAADTTPLDVFNIGDESQSLVNSAHLLVLNSWNELLVLSAAQDGATLPSLLSEILSTTDFKAGASLPKMAVFCRSNSRSRLLTQRLEALIEQITNSFYSSEGPKHTRFILRYAGHYHAWQYLPHIQHQRFENESQLKLYLAEPQLALSQISFDRHTLHQSPLKAMTALPTSNAIQVGYRVLPLTTGQARMAEILLLDERGSLFVEQLPFRDESSLLRPLHQFIRSAINRLCLTEQYQESFGVYPVEFYRLVPPSSGQIAWSSQRIEITTDLQDLNFFNIQAIATNDTGDEADYSFYCDDQEFHTLDYGPKTFRRVASYILARRRYAERYPCYITDLDLSPNHDSDRTLGLQISDYMKVKSRLENHLNQALQSI